MPETRIKARRFQVYRLSTFDCLNDEEHALYDAWKTCKKNNKTSLRKMYDEKIKAFEGTRIIPDYQLFSKDKNGEVSNERRTDKMIALFENEMARIASTFEETFPLVDEIVFLACEDENVMLQIICNGVDINKEHYLVYSSSANQQKKKMITLLKESFFRENEEQIMCGLSIDKINKGNKKISGCNTGKFLAYTSLIMSSSVNSLIDIDEKSSPVKLDIDDCILVNDFETDVLEKVAFLDVNTLKTEVKKMNVPVKHMDGSGVFLPGVLPASCQIRGGWLKGAMFPFDFQKFVRARKDAECIIIDAYGKEQDIVKNKTKAILTTSQLKMWKYYDSWEDYKTKFKQTKNKILINNISHVPENGAIVRISYQFLQTLDKGKITDASIEALCKKTLDYINGGKRDINIALDMMGVKEDENSLEPLQACMKNYDGMLGDKYVQSRLRDKIASERKMACGGKLYVDGFYSYICPDLYAFCEWLFCGIEDPKGLIPKYHVYNSYYNEDITTKEVDCLRSPHLGDSEHCIRTLVKSKECKEWFSGTDTVISTHDLITKHLQCDSDGDELLITNTKELINLVKRDNPPLYYEMGNADNTQVTTKSIYECLLGSFANNKAGGISIGDISNVLTKEWNSMEPDINFIRVMTAYNNFVIDFPKTHFLIDIGEYKDKYQYLRDEVAAPHFFVDAKKKKACNCAPVNASIMNRIWNYMHKNTSNVKYRIFDDAGQILFNPAMLKDRSINIDRASKEYLDLMNLMVRLKYRSTKIENAALRVKAELSIDDDFEAKHLKYDFFYHYCKESTISIFDGNEEMAATYLVDVEYCQEENESNSKNILWNCFGDILYKNLLSNMPEREKIEAKNPIKIIPPFFTTDNKEKKKINDKFEIEINKEARVRISQNEYDYISNLKYRANSQTDRYLLFILLVLCKRAGKNSIKLTQYKKYKGTSPAQIDNWIGSDVCKKGLERLKKLGALSYEVPESKRTINITLGEWINDSESEEYCIVGSGNPLIHLFKHNGERKICTCNICKREYISNGKNVCSSRICVNASEKRKLVS